MAEVGMDDKAIRWQPLSGPIRILNDHKLDRVSVRLVPKKPIPLDGLKLAIKTLTNFNVKYMPPDCKQVCDTSLFSCLHDDVVVGMGHVLW